MNRQRVFAILASVATLVGLLATSVSVQAVTAVFINEIHYDNTGTDTGEAIEIAGPAGTDLTGWSLVLYNGNGGAVYDTDALSGTIPNLSGGYGVVVMTYPSNGIQNGAPDGIALVDSSANVIQFLSYEGTFTAVGGPADGLLSTDIGVLEDGSGAVGDSLQLAGSGTVYEDFTWSTDQPNTFGAVNTGQTFTGGPSAPAVSLNEIVVSTGGTDQEFFELTGAASTSLDGVTFLEVASGGQIDTVLDLSGGAVPADGNWVAMSPEAETVLGVTGDLSFPDNTLSNSSQTYLLVFEFTGVSGDDIDADDDGSIDNPLWTSVVDSVAVIDDDLPIIYSGNVVGPDGTFLAAGGYRCPDGDGSWNMHAFGDPADYTPGTANACAPAAPLLVINEIDYDQPGTDAAEFIEIRNNSGSAVDLSGVSLDLINGNGTVSYGTIALPAGTLTAGDYFVVCGDASNVPNCDLDVTPDTNLIQNGAPDAVALLFNGSIIDTVSYEGDVPGYTEGSGAGLEDPGADGSISRCPDGSDTDQNNVDFVFSGTSTPGAENVCAPPPVETCGDPFTPIYAVQGSGAASPLVGMTVSVEGVVVGDFQNNGAPDNGELNGFHIQDPLGDGDAATSDGVFIYAPGALDVMVGDAVRVQGLVSEFNEMTEITASQVLICSTGNSIAPSALSLPVSSVDDFEPYEGMLVTFPQDLVIAEYFNFDRFGEIVLTSLRHLTPTALFEPGPDAIQAAEEYLLDRITLDDGRTSQNPDPAIHPNGMVFDLDNLFRGGSLVTNVTGVLDYAFGLYRIQPTQGAIYTDTNPRPADPDPVGGSLKVSSFNVLNYFTTIDNGLPICGPAGDQECRGADTEEEFTRQRDKIISALVEINADVVGLTEIENHPGDVPTADLVSGLNDQLGAGTYAYIATGAIGTDAIRVALLYKPASVTPVGSSAILDSTVDSRFNDDKNRPVLAQSFMQNSTGGVFTAAINHLKSKGSPCDDVGDPDLGDGAGNCNLTRLGAAEALVDWLATDPTASGDPDVLIIGDLNSYDKEDPIDAIVAGPDDVAGTGDDYTELVYNYLGEGAYSYVFDGQIGYLDYGLANASLAPQVTGTTIWHINADEADLIDYDTTFKQPAQVAIYAPDAYRSSDHDPVIVGLNLSGLALDCSTAYASREVLWPPNHKFVKVRVLGLFAPDGSRLRTTITGIFQDEPVVGPGSGNTAPDGFGVGTAGASIRAERDGGANGRVYHIYFTAMDRNGNSCSGEVLTSVPLTENGDPAVDDGPLYDSTHRR